MEDLTIDNVADNVAKRPLPLFNPRDPDFIRDPYPTYHRLRRQSPLLWDPAGNYWLATSYDVCSEILRDRRFGRRYEAHIENIYRRGMMDQTAFRLMAMTMLMQEPPDHARLRGLVTEAFSARRVVLMRQRIRTLVGDLLDRLVPRGTMDVIRDFAHVLPVTVICDLLGIPAEDRRLFHETAISTRMLDPVPMNESELREANAMFEEQGAYFTDLFERRRRDPEDDLITALVQVGGEGGLTDDELLANVWLLFAAGHETTRNLIGNGLLALHRNPGQLARLRLDPSLIPSAVTELLRYDSPVQFVGRTAFEDTDIAGTTIAEGQVVLCLVGAANRDPAKFDEPDLLDFGRSNNRPLSFGGGIHFCLGAQLTQIEGQEAFVGILSRLPGMRLHDADEPSWQPNFAIHGLKALMASWDLP